MVYIMNMESFGTQLPPDFYGDTELPRGVVSLVDCVLQYSGRQMQCDVHELAPDMGFDEPFPCTLARDAWEASFAAGQSHLVAPLKLQNLDPNHGLDQAYVHVASGITNTIIRHTPAQPLMSADTALSLWGNYPQLQTAPDWLSDLPSPHAPLRQWAAIKKLNLLFLAPYLHLITSSQAADFDSEAMERRFDTSPILTSDYLELLAAQFRTLAPTAALTPQLIANVILTTQEALILNGTYHHPAYYELLKSMPQIATTNPPTPSLVAMRRFLAILQTNPHTIVNHHISGKQIDSLLRKVAAQNQPADSSSALPNLPPSPLLISNHQLRIDSSHQWQCLQHTPCPTAMTLANPPISTTWENNSPAPTQLLPYWLDHFRYEIAQRIHFASSLALEQTAASITQHPSTWQNLDLLTSFSQLPIPATLISRCLHYGLDGPTMLNAIDQGATTPAQAHIFQNLQAIDYPSALAALLGMFVLDEDLAPATLNSDPQAWRNFAQRRLDGKPLSFCLTASSHSPVELDTGI